MSTWTKNGEIEFERGIFEFLHHEIFSFPENLHIYLQVSYLDQKLPQYESLYPIGLISARIKILVIGYFFD